MSVSQFSPLLKDAIVNEFVFGAFLAWGFELVIINGAFIRSVLKSLLVSAIHPIPILLLVLSETPHVQLYSPISGVVVLVIVSLFLARVNSVKTRKAAPSLDILRAFLRTWVEHKPDDLETYFAGYAQPEPVTSDLIIARNSDNQVVASPPGDSPRTVFARGQLQPFRTHIRRFEESEHDARGLARDRWAREKCPHQQDCIQTTRRPSPNS